MPRACFYVSGHGFGHSARVQAVVERLLDHEAWTVELRTSAPVWFHRWLLGDRCVLTHAELDPGVVQQDVFEHDAAATRRAWTRLLGRADELAAREAEHLRDTGCSVVVGDMVPLAFAAARAAGLPSLAMGNFTWDWILEHYLPHEPGLASVIRHIRRLYAMADRYLRLPMSHETDVFDAQREVSLVARRGHEAPDVIRGELGVTSRQILVLVCFGGVGFDGVCLEQVSRHPNVRCVWDREETVPDVMLSVSPETHYPDLIRAADVVLTKPGYGIFAESMAHGTPVAYAHRDGFREAALLEEYIRRTWPSAALTPGQLSDGSWTEPTLALAGATCPAVRADGADQVVEELRRAAAG